jgi:sulfite exporter TauE/SafE
MLEASLLSVFLLGLLGGAHCAAMCGPIVGAALMAGRRTGEQTGPAGKIRIVALSADAAGGEQATDWSRLLAYNFGRILSYIAAGSLAGAVGSAAWFASHVAPVQRIALALAGGALIAMGLYLLGVLRPLGVLESAGRPLWRRVTPLAARVLKGRRPLQSLGAGLVWGLIPCGMVYAMLVAALASGSAADGALLAAAFGAGTLPNLLAIGWAASRSIRWLRAGWLRRAAGVLILAFGVLGVVRSSGLSSMPLPGHGTTGAAAGHQSGHDLPGGEQGERYNNC